MPFLTAVALALSLIRDPIEDSTLSPASTLMAPEKTSDGLDNYAFTVSNLN